MVVPGGGGPCERLGVFSVEMRVASGGRTSVGRGGALRVESSLTSDSEVRSAGLSSSIMLAPFLWTGRGRGWIMAAGPPGGLLTRLGRVMSARQNSSSSSRGRRVLSAIMFTDVVGFSARMGENETQTTALVRRDLEFMGRRCEQHRGRVVKTTGDGLLVVFDSAVEAVSAAVEIQRAVAEAGRRLAADQILRHRIAVHLGDIITTEDDVLGEGVNIAARLQELADPGDVCISAATYELVKNRLKLESVYVGPCELKNISEPVGVYRISVGGAKPRLSAAGARLGAMMRSRRWWWRAGAAAAVAVVFVMLALVLARGDAAGKRQDASSAAATGSAIVAPAQPAAAPVPTTPEESDDFAVIREQYVARHDFAGLAARLLTEPGLIVSSERRRSLVDHYQSLGEGMANIRRRMKLYDARSPLLVAPPGEPKQWRVWMGDDNRVHVLEPEGERTVAFEELTAQQVIQIVHADIAAVAPMSKGQAKAVGDFVKKLYLEYNAPRKLVRQVIQAS